jgi:hypothetical protein
MLNEIINHDQSQHATATTKENVKQLLEFAATYPNTTIRYYESDMIL